MKILFVCPSKKLFNNPFIIELSSAMKKLGYQVNTSVSEFWKHPYNYDIIHIQWPHAIFNFSTPTTREIIQLKKHFDNIRGQVQLIYTRHNEKPHYNNDKNLRECYKLVEESVDAIIQLGKYGIDELKKRFSQTQHFIIPHHIYENIYNIKISKKEARTKLHIPLNDFVILSFGAFRNIEEAQMIIDSFKIVQIPNKRLIAPSIGQPLNLYVRRRNIFKWISAWRKSFQLKRKHIYFSKKFVEDKEVSYYFAACDVVLIQRKKILNSGNLPLAFYFSKVVIGPNIGNVGITLRETNNYTFNPNKLNSITSAIEKAYRSDRSSIEKANYLYAKEKFTLNKIALMHINVYNTLLNKK